MLYFRGNNDHREDLKSLEYLKCCIKESLRLYPPVSLMGRVLAQDTTIGGHTMPKGTPLTICVYTIHRHPDFWENPNVRTCVRVCGLEMVSEVYNCGVQ